ncbi:hypothetical protein J14TS2_31520 [Bacillus sp. J14TS2]|uniref:VOC family protein n=1 Tax=Bacillus sp. J14TS2 TaxID=2807188 RepID=UPI001B00DBF7|nr:VOC family protein [Bacillus sp. J14TS2]GIN72677.1 hypothetical protein J14TS2_31520 [Bacillus sp. J14TS2]
MEKTAIKNQMNSVFVHVTNLKASAKWYCDLLALQVDLDKIVSPVFNVPVVGTTSLTLDDHAFDPDFQHKPSLSAIFNFYTSDIDEAYYWVEEKGIELCEKLREQAI